jgi:hypothetical protein
MHQEQIPYMLTGSIVSSIQGEIRTTHNIDVVVELDEVNSNRLYQAFHNDRFYIDKNAIITAIKLRQMFNVLEIDTGDKIDFWINKDSNYDKQRFSRRIAVNFMGQQIYVTAPEDTILSKLKWAEMCGGSEKQMSDVLGVYCIQQNKLDLHYIEYWINELKLHEYWQQILERAS